MLARLDRVTGLVIGWALVWGGGCGEAARPVATAPHSAHEHPSHGPHDGELIELGDEQFHAELVPTADNEQVTIYLLDATAQRAALSESNALSLNLLVDGKPQQYQLAAQPLAHEPAGKSSRFVLRDAALVKILSADHGSGRLNVVIDGKPFVGKLAPHRHNP